MIKLAWFHPYVDKIILVCLTIIPLRTFAAKYFFNVVLSHVLTVTLYGDFIFALTTFFMFSSLILLGTSSASTRFLAMYLKTNALSTAEDYIRWNFRFVLESSLYFIGFLTLSLGLMLVLHFFNIKAFQSYHITVYLLFLTPIGALAYLLAAFLQCNNNIVLYNLLYNGACFVLFLILIAVLRHWYHPDWDCRSLWVLTALVFTTLVAIELLIVCLCLPATLIKSFLHSHRSSVELCSALWRKVSLRLCINRMLFLVLCVVDLYAVKLLVPGNIATSQYAALLAISSLLWLVGSTIYSKIIPELTYGIKHQDRTLLRRVIKDCNITNLLASTTIGLLTIYFGKHLIHFFGSTYLDVASYRALIILMVGYYLGSFANTAIALLRCSGDEMWLIYISLSELLLMILSAYFLTRHYGIIGAALASTLTISCATLTYIGVAYWKVRINALTIFVPKLHS